MGNAKNGKGGAGGAKGPKPAGMPEELWALQGDMPKLVDAFRGVVDKSAGGRQVSKEQARPLDPPEAETACQLWPTNRPGARVRTAPVRLMSPCQVIQQRSALVIRSFCEKEDCAA
jgi:hypothetical protein